MNESLIEQIINKEWKMFSTVPNAGGKASCQEDRQTFIIMRSSQFLPLPQTILHSYLKDLTAAEKEGRNLMTEKYARMMEFTSPDEFSKIRKYLPKLSNEAIRYISQIVEIFIGWEKELSGRFPNLMASGRPISASGNTMHTTSVETYMKGELSTYSFATLKLYLEYVLQCKEQHVNLAEQTHTYQARQYGYQTLQNAEDSLKAKN